MQYIKTEKEEHILPKEPQETLLLFQKPPQEITKEEIDKIVSERKDEEIKKRMQIRKEIDNKSQAMGLFIGTDLEAAVARIKIEV